LDVANSLPRNEAHDPYGLHQPGRGLQFYTASRSSASPLHLERNVIVPVRTIGIGTNTTLKMSFWHSTVEEAPQLGDPAFVSVSMRTSGTKAWRDSTPSGPVTTLPFEGANWRFEQPMSFVQFHLPFPLLGMVCDAIFDRGLAHADLQMPAHIRDARLLEALRGVLDKAASIEPTNLLLDSWALILSEAFLRGLSSHGERGGRATYGRIAARGIARVVDYVEGNIDQDLRLASLAAVAAMSVYHFARSFKETVGLSPHAYVLSRRIARARAMLHQSDAGLAAIALACGFSSQAHLTSTFQLCLGVTPGDYRRSMRGII